MIKYMIHMVKFISDCWNRRKSHRPMHSFPTTGLFNTIIIHSETAEVLGANGSEWFRALDGF